MRDGQRNSMQIRDTTVSHMYLDDEEDVPRHELDRQTVFMYL